jgi:hypothetical protein
MSNHVIMRMVPSQPTWAIFAELAPILQRLDLSIDAWLATMLGWRMFAIGAAMGKHAQRMTEAARRGMNWLRNRCPLFPALPAAERRAVSA